MYLVLSSYTRWRVDCGWCDSRSYCWGCNSLDLRPGVCGCGYGVPYQEKISKSETTWLQCIIIFKVHCVLYSEELCTKLLDLILQKE